MVSWYRLGLEPRSISQACALWLYPSTIREGTYTPIPVSYLLRAIKQMGDSLTPALPSSFRHQSSLQWSKKTVKEMQGLASASPSAYIESEGDSFKLPIMSAIYVHPCTCRIYGLVHGILVCELRGLAPHFYTVKCCVGIYNQTPFGNSEVLLEIANKKMKGLRRQERWRLLGLCSLQKGKQKQSLILTHWIQSLSKFCWFHIYSDSLLCPSILCLGFWYLSPQPVIFNSIRSKASFSK